MSDNKKILLSIVFGAKNDSYMEYSPGIGGANHRISISINKWLDNIEKCNIEYNTNDIELVICDWNSKEKIIDYVIDSKYKNYTYIFVPEKVACQYNTEFSIVHSLNCAYKHSTGEYILFCDSDSYFSYENFKRLYNLIKNIKIQDNFETGYWIPRKHIPREDYINFKNFIDVDNHLMNNNINYIYDGPIYANNIFCGGAAGLLISKFMAEETTCWYEKYINWGELDIDMNRRLIAKYQIDYIDINSLCFLHLYHHDSSFVRIPNRRQDTFFKANDANWGLGDKILEVTKK
jgi:predicted glycosyltransferase involved in capsule biosynthesis